MSPTPLSKHPEYAGYRTPPEVAHWKPSAVAAFAVGVLVGAFFTALFLLVALGDR